MFLALAHMLDATHWSGVGGDDIVPCTCTHDRCTQVETARGASKIAGSQCVDRLWQSLKRFFSPKLAAKDPKTNYWQSFWSYDL